MNDTNTTYIAFTEAKQADCLDDVFDASRIREWFGIYMDEKIHSDPNEKWAGPKKAGLNDARRCPPLPESYSESDYLCQLNKAAGHFLIGLLEICKDRFRRIRLRLDKLKREPMPETDRLETEVNDFNKIKDQFRDKYGIKLFCPIKPPWVMFVAIVFFIAVFEFVWVWYFLSDQLGLSTAIYASMVATTLVIVIAVLFAFSRAVTTEDMDGIMRNTGYCGMALCFLMFLFGVGLLSGLRSDSTNEGMDLIIEGYQSMTNIDVFVTALINVAGFIFLTHEFKRFFWPYSLYSWGKWEKLRAPLQKEIEKIEEDLDERLNTINKIIVFREHHKRSMKEFGEGEYQKKIELAKKTVSEEVVSYRGNYIIGNELIRKHGPYALSSDDGSNSMGINDSLFDDERINEEIKEIEKLIVELNEDKSIDDYLKEIKGCKDKIKGCKDKINKMIEAIDNTPSRMEPVK